MSRLESLLHNKFGSTETNYEEVYLAEKTISSNPALIFILKNSIDKYPGGKLWQ
jgi:hypothetical protein